MDDEQEPVLQIPEGWQERAPEGWDWQSLWEAVEEGDHKFSHDRVQEAIDADIDPRTILDDGLFPGFNLQGDRFSAQIIFIPEMLITARAMKAGLALIRPLLAANAEKPVGTFVIGTVLGDMHDIGQSIVTIMLENAGFNAINHDHGLHSLTAGPDGKFYFNNGNCGAVFTDKSGKTFYLGGTYGGTGGSGRWTTSVSPGRGRMTAMSGSPGLPSAWIRTARTAKSSAMGCAIPTIRR